MFMKKLYKNRADTKDITQTLLQTNNQFGKNYDDKMQQINLQQNQHHSIQSLPENSLIKKKSNQRKVTQQENVITHCSCCPFYSPNKQHKWHERFTKQIIFIEDDFDTYLLHKEKQNEQNNRIKETKCSSEGLYFSKNELEVINQGPLPKQLNSASKDKNEIYQQQQNPQQQQQQQLQQQFLFNPYLQNRLQVEEDELKRKNFFLNQAHNRTKSYDSYAQTTSKQWLEQISEEREEQESQLTFQNKHLTHANSSQNLRSENRYLMTSNRNSIGNLANAINTRRSSMSGGDNERSFTNQNQVGFQHSQQNTPQMSIIAPSLCSSSSYMPQHSLNIIEPHQNNSELGSTQQLSIMESQSNVQTARKRNQHFRSQSCPYSLPYFKYIGQSILNEDQQFNGQNIRVMTIHEEEPYHNYVNTSNYQCSSNNSTRNKYRQQQPYRQNTNHRTASGGNYSHSNLYENTSQTPNTIVFEKNQQLYTNTSQLPYTNTPFCFEHHNVTPSNLQADENQYLQESFRIYDGDHKEELSAIRDTNTINISNRPSLDNKFERDNDNESFKEGKGLKLKSQGQPQSQLPNIAQNTRYRGASLVNEMQNNSNSCSLNYVKSLNQLDTDQGFISFRKEHSCSSSQEVGIVDNFRSSHNSIDVDLKQKIKENSERIQKRQILKRQVRLKAMINNMIRQSDKEMQDFLIIVSNKPYQYHIGRNSNISNSFSQNGGSSSGKKLPSIPLLQSYQGSSNSHTSTLSSILFPAQSQIKGQHRGKNFWSYDFPNGNKSFLSNDTSAPFKKGGEEENNLRKAIVDGFKQNQLIKPQSQKQSINQLYKKNSPMKLSLNSEQYKQPTAKFLTEKYNLQLPQNLSSETYKNIVLPLSTAPASLQFYQNNNQIFNSQQNNQLQLNNIEMKIPTQISILSPDINNSSTIYNFNSSSNNNINNNNNCNSNNQTQNSTNMMSKNLIAGQQNLSSYATNVNSYAINDNIVTQNQQYHLNNTQNNYQNDNSTNNHLVNKHSLSSSLQNTHFNNKNNNLTNSNNSNINQNINNNLNIQMQKSNQFNNPNIINSPYNSIQNQQQGIALSTSNNSQLNNNNNYPLTSLNSPGGNNSINIINNTVNHNINTVLLNRISEECESPANTTYKQQQEYLNYESEQYLTGSKSQYHKKQQLLASGESNNTSSKPLDEGSSSQQIQLFDKQSHNSYKNDKQNQLIERFSSSGQLEHFQNQPQNQNNNHQLHDQNLQQQASQNATTMFNLLNHTIANPNNLNQSHQQNPSANNSWFESSRSYEILMLDENKARNLLDGQTLSFSKTKNAPSSHLSSQKSLHGINSNVHNNQDNMEINLMQSNLQNINTNFINNNQNTSLVSLSRVRSGENTPNDRDDDQHRFNQSQEIADALIGETNNEDIPLRNKLEQQKPFSTIQKLNQIGGFHFPLLGKRPEISDQKLSISSPQRFDEIIQSLTKSLNPYQIQQDLQQVASSQQYQNQQINVRKGQDLIPPPYLQKFPSKISEEQSKMQSSGSNFNTSNNNFNTNVNSQNKLMASSNQFSNVSQYLNTQYDNQNGLGGLISGGAGDYINFDSSKSVVQAVNTNNKQNQNLTNKNNFNNNQNVYSQNNYTNVNSQNNNFNNAISNHNIHNLNNNFAISHRSSSSTSNSNYNFMENQGVASVERMSEPGQSIEIQIERRQNNHYLLIQALKKQLQDSKPKVLAEIEEHIRQHPHYCFILVLQEDQPQQFVLKGIFHVYSQTLAKKSYQIEDIPNTIRLEDVDEFLKIDREDYSLKDVDQPSSFRKVEGVILKSQYS